MSATTINIPRAARLYFKKLLTPLPIPRVEKGKGCKVPGWPTIARRDVQLDVWFNPKEKDAIGVGIRLGDEDGQVVDADLDCPEAIAAGAVLLPPTTFVYGRASARRSHYLYQVAERTPREVYLDPTMRPDDGRAVLCEYRDSCNGKGYQSVVPPTLHLESGERIEWVDPKAVAAGMPAEVDRDALLRQVRRVAAAALIGRHWPAPGSRNQAGLALAGALLRSGLSVDAAEAFVEAVGAAANDEESASRIKSVRSTADKIAAGENVTGWPKLASLLGDVGPKVVDAARGWLGLRESVPATAKDTYTPPAEVEWPAPPGAEALHGLAGEIVRAIEPHSEADPVALLSQILVEFGNVIGRTAYFQVEADRHYCNEFIVLVGQSSKGRKGTSRGQVHGLFRRVDEAWAECRNLSGLSSGEGLIWNVRDAIEKNEKVSGGRGEPPTYVKVICDDGIEDKRLLVYEPEFANVLKQSERQGNTLSPVIRQAWESGRLATLTKNSPARATDAHISIVGHITVDELRRYLTATESANGFANRYLWFAVRRSKLLPEGGRPNEQQIADLVERLGKAVEFARLQGRVQRDDAARDLWRDVYEGLAAERGGLAGALLGRAEAHVMRLALIYAMFDMADAIRPTHLMAAVAVWDYVERSVVYAFGDSVGDPLADELCTLIRQAGSAGISRTDISAYFNRHATGDRLNRALFALVKGKKARCDHQRTGGRPVERWYPL